MIRFTSLKRRLLQRLLARRDLLATPVAGAVPRRDLATVRETMERTPLLVHEMAALHLLACVRSSSRLGGSMAEAGVFCGGTARLICEAKGAAPLHLFDVFELLQGPPADGTATPRAAELRSHFKTVHGTRASVERLLAPYTAVNFHPGVFPDTARGLEGERFSFVHLDLDLEPSTRDALEFFHPRLLPGGILLGDDHQHDDVRRPFDAYFAGLPDARIEFPWGQVMVVKSG